MENKLKAKIRIPKEQYAFIEIEHEGTQEEIESIYSMFTGSGDGLNQNDWAKVRNTMLIKGEFDPNLWEELSSAQKFWVNETKKGLRSVDTTQQNNHLKEIQ